MNDNFSPNIIHPLETSVEQEAECTLETHIRIYKELTQRIAELEEQKKHLSNIILQQMKEKTMSVAGYVVRRYERINISTDLQKAREWNATIREEVVDKEKLKKLHQAGHEIPGISISHFIRIFE